MSAEQMQFNFDAPLLTEGASKIIIIQTYRRTKADQKFRKRIRSERGESCEKCGKGEDVLVHHILETRIYAQHAREPLNVLVLCCGCNAAIGYYQNQSPILRCAFYAGLSWEVRARHLPFLRSSGVSKNLIAAFEGGNEEYWIMQSIL